MDGKTPAQLAMEAAGAAYKTYGYPADPTLSAARIAELTGFPAGEVYKTLVCRGSGHRTYVCVIPSPANLDFEGVAQMVGENRLRLAPQGALPEITGGYVKGCCTPLGMRGGYPVFLDKSMEQKEKICLNGGRLGLLMELAPSELRRVTGGVFRQLCREENQERS